jgi:hypothetical protein
MVYPFIQAMEAGGLVSYGADIADLTRLAGKYIESRGREGANQILAFDPSRRHHLPSSGRLRQVALAHRARGRRVIVDCDVDVESLLRIMRGLETLS